MSLPLCFNIGLDGFSVSVLSETNDKLGLRSEDGQMSSSESQFHDLGVYIDRDLARRPHVRRTVLRCFAAFRVPTA